MPGTRTNSENSMIKDMYKVTLKTQLNYKAKYPEVFYEVKGAEGAGEKETQLLGADELIEKEAENQKIEFTAPEEGWQSLCAYRTYQRGLSLSKERVRDDVKIKNILEKYAATWGRRDMQKREIIAATVFNDGGDLLGNKVFNGTHVGNPDSSGKLLFDNYPLFNLAGNARSSKGGATYFNSVAGLTLTPANFETIYIRATVTNAYSELDIIEENPVDTLLVQAGADDLQAQRICKSEYLPGGQLNDINPYYNLVEPLVWRYLNDGNAFYVGKRQHPDFQFRVRQEPEIDYFEDKEDKSRNASYDIRFGIWILFHGFRIWTRGGGTSA